MKKYLSAIAILATLIIAAPIKSFAAGGIFASGGGSVTVGQTITVTVTASGATFDTVSGSISVSGPVSVTSFAAGDATWINKPSESGSFNGAFLGEKKTSFTVATIKLKANSVGSGAVTVSGASLKNAGSVVGTGSSNASFTIAKAPELPGAVKVSSSSHPDPATAYEATTIVLSWNKESGVDNFSYLLDQAATTTPAAKATDANTSATYADKAIGTYYFHIRAHKADGWGTTTHFKITIKEPDAKIDATLSAPSGIKIEKTADFVNNVTDGTVTGVKIFGKTEAGFTANLILTPAPTLPTGKVMTAVADGQGNFQLILDFPIVTGFHKLTIQGAKEKVLTPVSDEVIFEISQKNGGSINMLTSADANQPTPPEAVKAAEKSSWSKYSSILNTSIVFYAIVVLFVIIILIVSVVYFKRKKTADMDIKKIVRKMK